MCNIQQVQLECNNKIISYNVINIDNDLLITETRTKPLELTLKQVLEEIKTFDYDDYYHKQGGKDNKVADDACLPPFNLSFYEWSYIKDQIPTPEQFVDEYIDCFWEESTQIKGKYFLKPEYKNQICDNNSGRKFSNNSFSYDEIAARACRAYCSFVREIILYLILCQEKDFSVSYSFQEDWSKGKDLIVEYKGLQFKIKCSQESKKAEEYNQKKETTTRRTEPVNNDMVIRINYNSQNKKNEHYGEIHFFPSEVVQELINKIKRLEKEIREKGGNLNEF